MRVHGPGAQHIVQMGLELFFGAGAIDCCQVAYENGLVWWTGQDCDNLSDEKRQPRGDASESKLEPVVSQENRRRDGVMSPRQAQAMVLENREG